MFSCCCYTVQPLLRSVALAFSPPFFLSFCLKPLHSRSALSTSVPMTTSPLLLPLLFLAPHPLHPLPGRSRGQRSGGVGRRVGRRGGGLTGIASCLHGLHSRTQCIYLSRGPPSRTEEKTREKKRRQEKKRDEKKSKENRRKKKRALSLMTWGVGGGPLQK